QANFRAARQSSIGQLESAIGDYVVQGHKPRGAEADAQLFDSENETEKAIPEWLRESNFSGMAVRDEQPLLVVARTYPGPRTVVIAEPLDTAWARELEDRTGMI